LRSPECGWLPAREEDRIREGILRHTDVVGEAARWHTKDARAGGETEQRIYALNAWRETPFFNDRERAALAWVEALTHVGHGVPDDLYAEARKEFSEKELVDLTWAAAAINV
jgi:alkylhydroperoxidase family enzyme